MYVVSALALLTLFGGVEPLMLKNQPDNQQQPLPQTPHLAPLQSQYSEQQVVDNDGIKGQKPERLYPELRQLPQQYPYMPQSPVNPTLAYVIIKPIPQQLFPENLGYNRVRSSYLQQPYIRENDDAPSRGPPAKGQPQGDQEIKGQVAKGQLPADQDIRGQLPYGQTYIAENPSTFLRAPLTKGQIQDDSDVHGQQPLPPPPPPPPHHPDVYPVHPDAHDYLHEIHAKKQSKLSKLKQHIDRIFQKFASHSSYQIDDDFIPPHRPIPGPDDQQHPVQQQEQEPEPQPQPPKDEVKAPTKQQVIEEPKEIKEHREGEPKKEAVRAPQVASPHPDEGFSKRHNVN